MERAGGRHVQRTLGFHDYNRLQMSAACCLSDSGTIAEESTLLGFPAVTLRDSIERPEALDTGGIMMTGLDPGRLRDLGRCGDARRPRPRRHQPPDPG